MTIDKMWLGLEIFRKQMKSRGKIRVFREEGQEEEKKNEGVDS